MRGKKIKVLIVDDSAMVRQALKEIFEEDKEIEVIGAASDPYIAAKKIAREKPDVITLDIEMPRMDGLTFLKKIMIQHPMPVVIISSLTQKGAETALKALEYGAVEIITKPRLSTKQFISESKISIINSVKGASQAKPKRKKQYTFEVRPKLSADAIITKRISKSMLKTTEKVVMIGASTGGTEAIMSILREMPHDSPGIVIVQHMPELFTKSFSERLDQECRITVKEASDNDSVIRGRALIAPGNKHIMLKRSGARYYVEVNEGPLVNRHRPSVDVLFRSSASFAGKNSLGILLTGMGDDGAGGLLEMKEAGAFTIAQDEQTSVVFGMPKEAIKLGAANKVLPLHKIPEYILSKT